MSPHRFGRALPETSRERPLLTWILPALTPVGRAMSGSSPKASLAAVATSPPMAGESATSDRERLYEEHLRSHALYVEFHKDMRQEEAQSYRDQDQAILTLSSAALAVSLAFIADLEGTPTATWTLVASWAGFAVAILSTLLSFATSRSGIDAMIKSAERYYVHGDRDALGGPKPKSLAWTKGLNLTAAAAFAIGIVLTIVFVALNI